MCDQETLTAEEQRKANARIKMTWYFGLVLGAVGASLLHIPVLSKAYVLATAIHITSSIIWFHLRWKSDVDGRRLIPLGWGKSIDFYVVASIVTAAIAATMVWLKWKLGASCAFFAMMTFMQCVVWERCDRDESRSST
jgi:peptidoglycan biosynthesis protein MviN/MurJ (putative lipid II flippase)